MTKKEYDAQLPLIGRAQIVHNPGDNGKRRGTELRLTNSSSIEIGAICAPLFDPVLDTLNAQGLIIKGYEIESKDGAVFEHRQAWVVRPMFE